MAKLVRSGTRRGGHRKIILEDADINPCFDRLAGRLMIQAADKARKEPHRYTLELTRPEAELLYRELGQMLAVRGPITDNIHKPAEDHINAAIAAGLTAGSRKR